MLINTLLSLTSGNQICCWFFLHNASGGAVEVCVGPSSTYACPHCYAKRYTPEPVQTYSIAQK
jgi:hypothetical protein